MNRAFYEKISSPLRGKERAIKTLYIIQNAAVALIATAYVTLIVYLAATDFSTFLHALLTGGITFIAVDIFRRLLSLPRPKEKFGVEPLVHPDKTGKSFPSRHTYSAFLIGTIFLKVFFPVGIVIYALGIFIGCLRIVFCLHFVRDVLGGAVIGVVSGIIGMFLIP